MAYFTEVNNKSPFNKQPQISDEAKKAIGNAVQNAFKNGNYRRVSIDNSINMIRINQIKLLKMSVEFSKVQIL